MGKLELKPPLLIMTMGYPGSGKTFFARQFSEQYGLPLLSEDRIRYELFERPQFNTDEQQIIRQVYNYSLEQLMRTSACIVCDGSFSQIKERLAIANLAKKTGYRILTVWLQTDSTTSAVRARRRDRRNPDSKYSFDIDAPLFNKMSQLLQRPSEKEPSVVISGKHAYKGQSLTVLKKITQMYALSVST